MPSYLSQNEAANYAEAIGSMSAVKAMGLLAAASRQVDASCNRTFTGDQLTEDVKLAISLLAEWLSTAGPASGPVQSEKIGDYSVSYAVSPVIDLPLSIQMLLASSRIISVA